MTYCFRCPICGYTTQQSVRDPAPTCVHKDSPPKYDWCVMVRDYQAESATPLIENLRAARK